MKLVHVQTTVQTVFGLLDDDGNVIPQQPVTVQVQRFAPEAFTDAHTTIAEARDKALANFQAARAFAAPAELNGRPASALRDKRQ
jgi:hypothetical protein